MTFTSFLFGLGSAALLFHHTYLQYLRVTHAMETFCLPSFAGRMHRATNHPARLAVDLVTVVPRCWAYSLVSRIGFVEFVCHDRPSAYHTAFWLTHDSLTRTTTNRPPTRRYYIGEMLVWVHQVITAEQEFLEALIIIDSGARMPGAVRAPAYAEGEKNKLQ